jgi:ADP-heptose:LPS heptosyltransferase
VIVFDRKRWWREIVRLARELRGKYDVTLDLQRHFKSGVLSFLSRSPRRIGFHPSDAKELNWLFNTEHIPARGEGVSKVEHYLEFVKLLGFDANAPRPVLSGCALPEPRPEVKALLPASYVVLVLGSSWDSKDWPEEGYRALISKAGQFSGFAVVLVGDRTKIEVAERLERDSGGVPVVNLTGRTTVTELVWVIRGARACVGPDSGPGHIAGAVGVPYVTLFGPTHAKRNAPRGSERLCVVSNVGCSPCKRRVCPGLRKVCMRLISPDAVYRMLESALEGRGHANGALR